MLLTDNLKAVSAAFARHKEAVQNALKEYREDVSQCSVRYAPSFAKQKVSEAKETASARIAQADSEMHNSIMETLSTARRDICTAITTAPEEKFASIMREYKYHNLKMSETEIRAFAEQAAESYTGLRILQRVARDSGFRLSVSSVADIEEDIKRIEKSARVPSMYAPPEYANEACELLGEKPYFREDGSVYHRSGKPDATYLSIVNAFQNSLESDLETTIFNRWTQMKTVKIERIEDETNDASTSEEFDENKESTAVTQTKTERTNHKEFAKNLDMSATNDAAARVIEQNKAAEAQSRNILAHYVMK